MGRKGARRLWKRIGVVFSVLSAIVWAARFLGALGDAVPDALIHGFVGAGIAALVAVAVATFTDSDEPTLTADQAAEIEKLRINRRHALLMDQDFMGCMVIIGAGVAIFVLLVGAMIGGCPPGNPQDLEGTPAMAAGLDT